MPAPTRTGHRLGWLDALRGLAALAVVYTHFAHSSVPELYEVTNPWFSAGLFGVLLFFVISGYIVPASLDRKGSVRSFWVSRLFRLYPLWLAAILAVYVLDTIGWRPVPYSAAAHPKMSLLAHLSMLQQLMRVESYINVMWTLSLEMAFYCMVVALYVLGAHRRSAELSIGFAAASIIGGGGLIPGLFFMNQFGVRAVFFSVTVAFVAGLALSVTARRPLVIAGSLLLGAMGLALMLLNQEGRVWYFLLLPATMFAGTAIYRAERGETSRWKAIVAVAVLVPIALANGPLYSHAPGATGWQAVDANLGWILAISAVVAVFLAGRALRHRAVPRFLVLLGMMSYSLYLLHPLIYQTFATFLPGRSGLERTCIFLLSYLLLFVGSWLTYQYVEAPTQRWGRSVARWLDRRYGEDTSVSRVTPPAAAR